MSVVETKQLSKTVLFLFYNACYEYYFQDMLAHDLELPEKKG